MNLPTRDGNTLAGVFQDLQFFREFCPAKGPNRPPGLLIPDIDQGGTRLLPGGIYAKQLQYSAPAIEGRVNRICRDMGDLAGLEHTDLLTDPLLRLALQDIDNLLHAGMQVKRDSLRAGNFDPDHQHVFTIHQVGPAQPVMRSPGVPLHPRLLCRHKVILVPLDHLFSTNTFADQATAQQAELTGRTLPVSRSSDYPSSIRYSYQKPG